MNVDIDQQFLKIRKYCEQEEFKGYDPFDGLNSKFFQSIPFVRTNSFFRLLWIQFFKQNPINFRPLFGVKKENNPKGLGLFLSGYCNLYHVDPNPEYLDKIKFLMDKIYACQAQGYSGACCGYNFDWQARAFFQPKGTPSVVVSSFIACALLDAYQILKDEQLLHTTRSTCDFVLNDLHRTYNDDDAFAFSYSPMDQTQVFNASLLGCRLLCRVYQYTNESILVETSKKAVAYACRYQQENGAWFYSPLPFHQWVDSFHTGYNLECIDTYQTASGDDSFNVHLEKGLKYYLETFFREDGAPMYYNHSTYPIDVHNAAQLMVTLSKLGRFSENKELIDKVLNWCQENMFDQRKGYFYYYKQKHYTVKICYMRWIQAWMFLAYSHYMMNLQ